MWVKNIPSGRNRNYKVPQVGENLECSQNGMEASRLGVVQVQMRT